MWAYEQILAEEQLLTSRHAAEMGALESSSAFSISAEDGTFYSFLPIA